MTRLPTVEFSSVLITQPAPVEHASSSSDDSRDSAAVPTSEETVNPAAETEKVRGDNLDERSTADADEHAERTSYAPSLTADRTSTSTTSGTDDPQRQHSHSSDRVQDDLMSTTPEYHISRAE
jgi:hypothetical protein